MQGPRHHWPPSRIDGGIGWMRPGATAATRPYGLQTACGLSAGISRQAAGVAGESGGDQVETDLGDDEDPLRRRRRLEAVLLMAKSPLSTRKLAQLARLADGTEARTLVRELNRLYDARGRALRVEHVAGGYRIMTRPVLAPWLARLGHLPEAVRLSSPMMETLTVIAYRQLVSRADVEAVRGVNCGELLRQLLERDLIRIAGRGEELGRPYLYGTTKRFLKLFGLSGADALPVIDWHTLQEETDQDSSTSPKESAVSTAVAPVVPETGPEAADSPVLADAEGVLRQEVPCAVIEDEEDEIYEGGLEEDLDDEFAEDWVEGEEDDDELEADELVEDEDLDDEELDDEEAGDEWVEVDDSDDDWDDEDDEDDDWDEDDEDDDWD